MRTLCQKWNKQKKKKKMGVHHARFGDKMCVDYVKFCYRCRVHLVLEKNESILTTGRKTHRLKKIKFNLNGFIKQFITVQNLRSL